MPGPANTDTPAVGDRMSSQVVPCCAAKASHGKLLELSESNSLNDLRLTSVASRKPEPKSPGRV